MSAEEMIGIPLAAVSLLAILLMVFGAEMGGRLERRHRRPPLVPSVSSILDEAPHDHFYLLGEQDTLPASPVAEALAGAKHSDQRAHPLRQRSAPR